MVKKAGRTQIIVDDDEMGLMQHLARIPEFATYHAGDRFWLARMLQRELEMRQEMQQGIGARLRRLRTVVDELGAAMPMTIHELPDMLRSVLVVFQDDEGDETKPDEVDEWTEEWTRRLKQWMELESHKATAEPTIEDIDRLESAFVEMVVGLQKKMMQMAAELERFRVKRSAALAQAWDDWAMTTSMGQPPSPKRQRTVATQVDEGMIRADVEMAEAPVAAQLDGHDEDRSGGLAVGGAAVALPSELDLTTCGHGVVSAVLCEPPNGEQTADRRSGSGNHASGGDNGEDKDEAKAEQTGEFEHVGKEGIQDKNVQQFDTVMDD